MFEKRISDRKGSTWPQSTADTMSRVDVDISLIEDRGHPLGLQSLLPHRHHNKVTSFLFMNW